MRVVCGDLNSSLGAPVIRNVRVVSKPMRDIWVTPHELKHRTQYNTGRLGPQFLALCSHTQMAYSLGLWVIQTPYGVVSHRRCIEMGLGGQVIFAVNNGYQQWC